MAKILIVADGTRGKRRRTGSGKPELAVVSLRLPAAAVARARKLAAADDRPLGAFLRRILLKGLADADDT